MEYAIFNHEGFVVITGEIGSGKTTLIQKLLSEIDENINVAKIFQTQLDEVEFLQAVLVEFGMNPFSAKKVELLNMLNQFLIDSYMNNKHVVLIVDDAQNLSKRVLEEICMLSGVETQKEKILHVILVGQPELNKTLESPDMEQLLQRISLRYHMRALTEDETKKYVEHRLSVAGYTKQLFKDECFEYVFKYCGGIPRLINTLCDTAMTCLYADNEKQVTIEIMKTAVEELQWSEYVEYKAKDKQKNDIGEEQSAYSNQISELLDKHSEIEGKDAGLNRINSFALVEISKQLKRIADLLDKE
ncbi:MAG: AAA family ATPase [Gammaproteobacteria bacterium]|nr:AAA family ATPase [Gammaproteobacteria bacterium]